MTPHPRALTVDANVRSTNSLLVQQERRIFHVHRQHFLSALRTSATGVNA